MLGLGHGSEGLSGGGDRERLKRQGLKGLRLKLADHFSEERPSQSWPFTGQPGQVNGKEGEVVFEQFQAERAVLVDVLLAYFQEPSIMAQRRQALRDGFAGQ